jgi:hypothetical protein
MDPRPAYAGREEGKRTIPEELPCLMAIWRSHAGFFLTNVPPDVPAVPLPYRLPKREGTDRAPLSLLRVWLPQLPRSW